MSEPIVLEKITREEILDGHEEIAPVDRTKRIQLRQSTFKQSNSLFNLISEETTQGGPLVDRHPDFIDFRGTPLSHINPDNDHLSIDIVGDPLLNKFDSFSDDLSDDAKRSREENRNKLRNRPQLTNKLNLQDKPNNAPQNTPKPRPG